LKANSEFFNHLLQINGGMELLSEEIGTRENPALTCRDLALTHPEYDSGMYWVDPNGGTILDAVEVYCDIPNHQTCIMPKPDSIEATSWSTETVGHTWFSENGGSTFTYKIDNKQLKMLQSLSGHVTQTITYNCRNSDAKRAHFKSSMTESEGRTIRVRPFNVAADGCKFKQDTWASSTLEFSTTRTDTLPVIDVAPRDDGSSNQGFGLEIGQVCFS